MAEIAMADKFSQLFLSNNPPAIAVSRSMPQILAEKVADILLGPDPADVLHHARVLPQQTKFGEVRFRDPLGEQALGGESFDILHGEVAPLVSR
jgi:hypothetical protein